MFFTEESETEKLRSEVREWTQRHNEALKAVMELNKIIKKLEKRNEDLIEISSAAIKYHQGNKFQEPQVTQENGSYSTYTNELLFHNLP